MMTVLSCTITPTVANAAVSSNAISATNTATIETSLKQTVQTTITQLAQHAPFTSWTQVATDIQPLGAGTHGWLVRVLNHDNMPIGYLIFHATEQGGYQLTEYGEGPDLPYDHLALKQALTQHGIQQQSVTAIEPVYYTPLIAAWKIKSSSSTKWIDAITGELLPQAWMQQLDKRLTEQTKITTVSTSNKINKTKKRVPIRTGSTMRTSSINSQHSGFSKRTGTALDSSHKSVYPINALQAHASIQGQAFDPYDNILWMASNTQLRGERAINRIQSWNPATSSQNWIYVIRKEQSKKAWNIPYAVIGKQQWTAATEQSGEITHTNAIATPAPSSTLSVPPNQRYWIMAGTDSPSKRWLAEDILLEHGYITSNEEEFITE
ncbi:hypothetical protein [Paenibacillus arenosi]|uniref:Uncharacterized protein n=1 Tax=Paenibacillus arenosi TaxID=2774142 RepID=A0ABR9AXA2_9BACL|nr:hypothetical protein [Paenibacillus arenosi]MBD8498723.1 hypothetical protein [Paenibacillus arenosi]